MFSSVRHIFFDLDHTLWDFETNSREALSDMYARHGLEEFCRVPFCEFMDAYEAINHAYWNRYSRGEVTKEALRHGRFYDAFLKFGYDNLELAKHWAEEYLALSPYKTNLLPGTLQALDHLQQQYSLHLITNGFKEVQYIKLDHSKLKPYFQTIIISEEHNLSKPDLRIFRLAEQLSGAMPGECVMVGDSYESDIAGAAAAGWKTIHFDPREESHDSKASATITALDELLGLFPRS